MIKVLVTGSTGAVGRDLVPFLLEHVPCEILTINRSVQKASEIFGVIQGLQHTSIEDVNVIKAFAPEVAIHMASYVSNVCDEETGIKLIESNILYGFRLLEVIKNCSSFRLFVNFGTFAEFRSGTDHTDNAYLYSASKTAFRAFTEFYSQSLGFTLVHIVPYTIYGTRDQRKKILDHVFDSFQNETPVKMTPGNQVLDFIHIRDVCNIIKRVITFPEINRYHMQNIYMGSGKGYTLRDVAALMGELLHKNSNITWGGLPYRDRDIMYAVADISRLADLDCEPTISLEDGLMRYIKDRS